MGASGSALEELVPHTDHREAADLRPTHERPVTHSVPTSVPREAERERCGGQEQAEGQCRARWLDELGTTSDAGVDLAGEATSGIRWEHLRCLQITQPLIAFGNFRVGLDDTGSDAQHPYVKRCMRVRGITYLGAFVILQRNENPSCAD